MLYVDAPQSTGSRAEDDLTVDKALQLGDPWAHHIHSETSRVTQQVSHSLLVYLLRVIRPYFLQQGVRESYCAGVCVCVESQAQLPSSS